MNYISALLKNKCPRCREGDIFCNTSAYQKGFMKMNEIHEYERYLNERAMNPSWMKDLWKWMKDSKIWRAFSSICRLEYDLIFF